MAEWMNDFYSDTELLPRFTALDLALTPKLKSAKWLLQTWFNKPHIEEITNSWMRVKQTFLLDQSSIKQISSSDWLGESVAWGLKEGLKEG